MYIKSLNIEYSDAINQNLEVTLHLTKQTNFIWSNGNNTRGKTTLMRFIVWSLGYDIDLTSEFHSNHSKTTLILSCSAIKSITRISNKVTFSYVDKSSADVTLNVKNDAKDILAIIYPELSIDIRNQIIGLVFFDQDIWNIAWNRGKVTQRLKDGRAYRINIESIIASLTPSADYGVWKTLDKQVDDKLQSLSSIEDSLPIIDDDKANSSLSVFASKYGERIDELEYQSQQIEEKIRILQLNLNDHKNLLKIIKRLNIKVKTDNKIIQVTRENLIFNKTYKSKTIGSIAYLQSELKKTNTRISDLNAQRQLLIESDKLPKEDSLLEEQNVSDYYSFTKILSDAGISRYSINAIKKNLNTVKKNHRATFLNSIKEGDAYSEIWKIAVKFSQLVGLENSFSELDNRLLDHSLIETGTARSMVVAIFKLSILRYILNKCEFNFPIFFDSPAVSEMDGNKYKLFISAISKIFPNSQLVIASNRKPSIKNSNIITLKNGLFGNIK